MALPHQASGLSECSWSLGVLKSVLTVYKHRSLLSRFVPTSHASAFDLVYVPNISTGDNPYLAQPALRAYRKERGSNSAHTPLPVSHWISCSLQMTYRTRLSRLRCNRLWFHNQGIGREYQVSREKYPRLVTWRWTLEGSMAHSGLYLWATWLVTPYLCPS